MGSPSHAATHIAELQNISFAFTDLNLGDGIDPEFIESPGSMESGFGVAQADEQHLSRHHRPHHGIGCHPPMSRIKRSRKNPLTLHS